MASGTLIVDHATPDAHLPNDRRPVSVTIAIPMVAGVAAARRSKAASMSGIPGGYPGPVLAPFEPVLLRLTQ